MLSVYKCLDVALVCINVNLDVALVCINVNLDVECV